MPKTPSEKELPPVTNLVDSDEATPFKENMAAIGFTLAHDDGLNYEDWDQADIVIIGVSRTGKTPLSLYLSSLGWKIANVPIVMETPLHRKLLQLDHRRVIGLTMEPGQLILHRQYRQRRLRLSGPSSYTDPTKVYEEIKAALRFYRQGGFSIIDVTDKPVETIADQIINTVTRRLQTPVIGNH